MDIEGRVQNTKTSQLSCTEKPYHILLLMNHLFIAQETFQFCIQQLFILPQVIRAQNSVENLGE